MSVYLTAVARHHPSTICGYCEAPLREELSEAIENPGSPQSPRSTAMRFRPHSRLPSDLHSLTLRKKGHYNRVWQEIMWPASLLSSSRIAPREGIGGPEACHSRAKSNCQIPIVGLSPKVFRGSLAGASGCTLGLRLVRRFWPCPSRWN